MWTIQLYSPYTHIHAHMHCQSGLTALKVAQSEGRQDVCDILLQYTQQGSKVTAPEQGGSETSDEEEVGMDNNWR